MNDGIKPQMRTNKYYLCENMDRKNIEKSFYNYFRNDKKINETFDKTVIYIQEYGTRSTKGWYSNIDS